MPLPYDPTKDGADLPSDTLRLALSFFEHQHAATSTAVAPVTLSQIRPTEIQEEYDAQEEYYSQEEFSDQEEYSGTEASDDSHNETTGSPHERSTPLSSPTSQDRLLTSQKSLMKEQAKLIRNWATRSSNDLASILEENMQSHLSKEYALHAEAHREEMETELTPIVYSKLYKDMRHAVKSDLRAEQLPLVRQELREEVLRGFFEPLKKRVAEDVLPYKAQKLAQADQEVEEYRQQRMKDTENACKTHFNNECLVIEDELQARWEEKIAKQDAKIEKTREKKMNNVEDAVENRARQFWESERVRVTREMEEYEKSKTQEMEKYIKDSTAAHNESVEAANTKLVEDQKRAYSDLEKELKEEKRKQRSEAKMRLKKREDEKMAPIDAEIASEKVIADQVNEDTEKGRSVPLNKPRTSRKSALGTKRARENEEETTESKLDSKIESQSVSINQKHDGSDGSTRPIKRIRHNGSSLSSIPGPSQEEDAQQCDLTNEHAVQPSFAIDTNPSGGPRPETVPTYHRSTDAVLGAKAAVPKPPVSIPDWSCNLDAPEQEDSVGPRAARFFETSQAVTAPVNSTGTTAANSTPAAVADSPAIVMSTSKKYQFGTYQTLVDPAILARVMANNFQPAKPSNTEEKIVSTAAAVADEDDDDEL